MAPDIDVIHRYIAYGSVGASTVRGLRTKGVVNSAREALRDVNLKPYGDATAKSFRKTLDSDTENVRRALPAGVRYWGVARKVLNIFLRGSLYNTYLTAHFGLARLDFCYEIPLDSSTRFRQRGFATTPVNGHFLDGLGSNMLHLTSTITSNDWQPPLPTKNKRFAFISMRCFGAVADCRITNRSTGGLGAVGLEVKSSPGRPLPQSLAAKECCSSIRSAHDEWNSDRPCSWRAISRHRDLHTDIRCVVRCGTCIREHSPSTTHESDCRI